MKLENEIHQKEFPSEHNKVLLNILYTHSFLVTKISESLSSHKITRQQYNVLRILRGQHPQSVPLGLIRERMLDKMWDASRMVERLRLKGLIFRKANKKDKRAVAIGITPKGLKFLEDIDPTAKSFDAFLNNLSIEEAKKLNILLDKLRG